MRSRFCKVVATVGPASASAETIRLLHEVGVDVFRLNFSHGDHDGHAKVLKGIRRAETLAGGPIAALADLQGPKLRVGPFQDGGIDLRYGDELRLEASDLAGEAGVIRIPHPEILKVLEPGDVLKLDDGKLQLTVASANGATATAKVDVAGRLTDRKGLGLVGKMAPIPALTEKDKADLAFALDLGVDYVALSFVQRPEDVEEARALIGGRAGVIVKLEKPSAIEALDEIVALADAVMVARGDLGVELPPEQVPVIQRRIIRTCRAAGKPVIVATHMLESMVDAPTPTRAEASDVASAVYQGADAVMLSAESAVGRHPAAAVAIMDRIIAAAEADPEHWMTLHRDAQKPEATTADAISLSARHIAEVLNCAAVVAFTTTGSTALRISRDRPPCRILGVSPDDAVTRRLMLAWGVTACAAPDVRTFDEMCQQAERLAVEKADVPDGERIIIAAGVPFGRPGKTNTIKISRIGAV
ncbi:MAG: pyruvate kinase [Pseudomonadota bacterium]